MCVRRMPSESAILASIRLLSRGAVRLFRNNVGVLLTEDGRKVRVGLCNGSSDLIGWQTRVIGGQRVAVFTAIEVKRPGGQVTDEQQRFLQAVADAGGIAGVAHSEQEARQLLSQGFPDCPPDER